MTEEERSLTIKWFLSGLDIEQIMDLLKYQHGRRVITSVIRKALREARGE